MFKEDNSVIGNDFDDSDSGIKGGDSGGGDSGGGDRGGSNDVKVS